MDFLEQYVERIPELDMEASRAAAAHIGNLTVPPGALGKLESLAVQLAGITGRIKPSFEKKRSSSWRRTTAYAKRGSAHFRRK